MLNIGIVRWKAQWLIRLSLGVAFFRWVSEQQLSMHCKQKTYEHEHEKEGILILPTPSVFFSSFFRNFVTLNHLFGKKKKPVAGGVNILWHFHKVLTLQKWPKVASSTSCPDVAQMCTFVNTWSSLKKNHVISYDSLLKYWCNSYGNELFTVLVRIHEVYKWALHDFMC